MAYIVVLTHIVEETKGDFFAGLRLVKVLLQENHNVEWILKVDVPEILDQLPINFFENKNCKIYILKNDENCNSNIVSLKEELAKRDVLISYPTILTLKIDEYSQLKESGVNLILISEYGFDKKLTEYDIKFQKMIENLEKHDITFFSTGISSESLGIFKLEKDDFDRIPNTLLELPSENQLITEALIGKSSSDITKQDLDTYHRNHALFFSYTNTEVRNHDKDLAIFAYFCVRYTLALKSNKKNIDIIGRFNENSIGFLQNLLNNLWKADRNNICTIRLVNPYPLKYMTMLFFLRQSQNDENPVAVTGDQSLSEAISIGNIFVYHAPLWKMNIATELLDHYQALNKKRIKNFIRDGMLGERYYVANGEELNIFETRGIKFEGRVFPLKDRFTFSEIETIQKNVGNLLEEFDENNEIFSEFPKLKDAVKSLSDSIRKIFPSNMSSKICNDNLPALPLVSLGQFKSQTEQNSFSAIKVYTLPSMLASNIGTDYIRVSNCSVTTFSRYNNLGDKTQIQQSMVKLNIYQCLMLK